MLGWMRVLITICLLSFYGAESLRGGLIRSGRSTPIFLRDGPLFGKRNFENENYHAVLFGKRALPLPPPMDSTDDDQTCSCRFPNGKTIIIVDQTGHSVMEPMRFG
ncbi:hypothetical protein M3Y97_01002600 [Aphelenchoides bicaudatus]|nr:hypothetical protein M3Y97_01002600 [Aphelenchoides bicaudatus]